MNHKQGDLLNLDENLDNKPLNPENEIKVPLPSITKGLKPKEAKLKSYRCLIFLPMFFFVFTSFLCGVQVYIAEGPHVREFEAIKGVIFNILKSDCTAPIYNVEIVPEFESCPDGFNRESIGSFGGTIDGCYNKIRTTVSKPTCKENKNFEPIKAIEAQDVWNWNGYNICSKRSTDILHLPSETSCPKGYKLCRSSPGKICIPPNDDCPITNIYITDRSILPNQKYRKIGQRNLVFENNSNSSRVLTGFLTSLNRGPCLDPDESVARTKHNGGTFYPLMVVKENDCENFGEDIDVMLMDKTSENKFYMQNGLYSVLDLPLMNEYTEGNDIVLSAHYTKGTRDIPTCQICIDPTFSELTKVSEDIWTTSRIYANFSKSGVVLIVVMFVAAFFNFYSYLMLHEDLEITYVVVVRLNMCVFGYMLGYFVTSGILAIINYVQVSNTISSLDDFVNQKCFENNQINHALLDLHQEVLPTLADMTAIGCLILAVAIITSTIMMIAHYILTGIKEPAARVNEENQPLRSAAGEVELGQVGSLNDASVIKDEDKKNIN